MTFDEVYNKLIEKNLLVRESGELLNGLMDDHLGLDRCFSRGDVYKLNYSESDLKKIYDYYTEVYSFIDKLDKKYIKHNDYVNISYFYEDYFCENENDKKIISFLEEEMGYINKFKKEEKTKKTKLPLILGVGICVGVFFYLNK